MEQNEFKLIIEDLLLGCQREIIFCHGELVLIPDVRKKDPKKRDPIEFAPNIAYLGVVSGGGNVPQGPYVELDPFYRYVRPLDTSSSLGQVKSKYGKLLANFFPCIWVGNSESIADALKKPPFEKMDYLASCIESLRPPYDSGLRDIMESGCLGDLVRNGLKESTDHENPLESRVEFR